MMILIINNNNTQGITIGKSEEWKVEMTDKNSRAVVLISISQLIIFSANTYTYAQTAWGPRSTAGRLPT